MLSSSGGGFGGRRLSDTIFDGTVQNMSNSVDKLKFGAGSVPAPTTDNLMQLSLVLYDLWPSLNQALQGNDASEVATKSETASAAAAALTDAYLPEANLGEPGKRFRALSDVSVLASKMVKEALLVRYSVAGVVAND